MYFLGRNYTHTNQDFSYFFLTQFFSLQFHPVLGSPTAAELSLNTSTESREQRGRGVIRGCRSFCAFSTVRNPVIRIPCNVSNMGFQSMFTRERMTPGWPLKVVFYS